MTAVMGKSRTAAAGEHIRLMQSLAHELERAMQAIARNDLEELEDSIAHQQALSSALGRLANELSSPIPAAEAVDSLDADLSQQIRHAVSELQRLNLRYSILLQHSSRSIAQMVSLFSSARGQFQEGSGPRSKHQTWSCQM
jgi:hypothetical protein